MGIESRAAVPLALLLTTCAFAQQYNFRNYSQNDGLANMVVNALNQDRDGFIWVGTENGVFRYDGFQFHSFGQAEGVPPATTYTLLPTSDGATWVAADGRLVRIRGDVVETVRFSEPVEFLGAGILAEDPDTGTVYAATSRGLAAVPYRTNGPLHAILSPPQAVTTAIFRDRDGSLWIAADRSLVHEKDGRVERYGVEAGLPENRWHTIIRDGNGDLWARSMSLLVRLKAGSRRFVSEGGRMRRSEGSVALSLDRAGNLMVPSDRGLQIRQGDGWRVISKKSGLSSESVGAAIQDREGSVWVGLSGSGLDRWEGYGEWENWSDFQDPSANFVWSLTRDRKGDLLVGSEWGVMRLVAEGTPRQRWEPVARLPRGRIRSMLTDTDGSIWVSYNSQGLARLDSAGRLTRPGIDDGMRGLKIYSLGRSRDGSIWAATTAGLYRRLPGGHFLRQDVPLGNAVESFFHVICDSRGLVWAAGTQGLALWNGQTWKRFRQGDGLRSDDAGRIAEAPDGSMWLGYRDSIGLTRLQYSAGRWRAADIGNRQDDTICYFLGRDARGWMWVGTDHGARVYHDGRWTNYRHEDGLTWNDTNANAFLADTDGRVWIGTSRGLSSFRPEPNTFSAESPKVLITSANAAGHPLSQGGAEVSYRDRTLDFRFTALTFRNERGSGFRFRLAGVDSDWIETDQHQARYPNLPAGSYTFEVMARTPAGLWGDSVARFPFRVIPPWWQANWFLCLCPLILAVAAAAVWRWRVRSILHHQKTLEQAVELRTRELNLERSSDVQRAAVLEMLANNAPLDETLSEVCTMVELRFDGSLCAVTLSHDGQFQLAAGRRLPREWIGVAFDPLAQLTTECVERLSGRRASRHLSRSVRSATDELLGELHLWVGWEGPGDTGVLEPGAQLAALAIEHARLYAELHQHAHFDSLTGLPNRILSGLNLNEAISRAERNGRRVGLLYLDLDRFKQINDSLSHRIGDLYLKAVAGRLQGCLGQEGLLARIGGDEFMIILPVIGNASEAEAMAARIIADLNESIILDELRLAGGVSIGISVFPEDGRVSEVLQRNADSAMYLAKARGRNRFESFSEHAGRLLFDKFQMETDLRQALRTSGLELFYQPKLSASGTVNGMEALIRYRHPKLGLIPPNQFIPLAEETGLIIPIGAWVLREACRQVHDWQAKGLPVVPVSVNVATAELSLTNYAADVARVVREFELDPHMIELELTESAVMADISKSIAQMAELRALGFSIAIDDFGTGYSSLSYLHKFPVNCIKVDQSFVQAVGTEASAIPLLRAVMEVARSLDLSVTAEGVETELQRDVLVGLGCNSMQGYLFSRPVDAHRMEEMLTLSMHPEPVC